MDVISNPVLDFKTLTAIVTANTEGMAIIGAWNGMETLARQKQAGMTETENNVTPRDRCDTKCDKRDRCDGERDTCNNRRDIACDTCDTTPEIPVVTEFPITYNSRCDTPSAVTTPYDSNNNINPLHPLQAHKPVSKYADLQNLMQRYGETLLCKTIAGIAGKGDLFFKNDCTWTISLNEKDVY